MAARIQPDSAPYKLNIGSLLLLNNNAADAIAEYKEALKIDPRNADAQFLLAPAGTTTEDLRELAMRQVPGDIVTLLTGALVHDSSVSAELVLTH